MNLHYNEQADIDTSWQQVVTNQQDYIKCICDGREGEKRRHCSTELTDTEAKKQQTKANQFVDQNKSVLHLFFVQPSQTSGRLLKCLHKMFKNALSNKCAN